MVVLILAVAYFAAVYLGDNLKFKMLVERIYLVSKRFFGVPTFFNYAIADGLYNLLFPDKTGINGGARTKKPEFQLCSDLLMSTPYSQSVHYSSLPPDIKEYLLSQYVGTSGCSYQLCSAADSVMGSRILRRYFFLRKGRDRCGMR
jgi:hypothetical protein